MAWCELGADAHSAFQAVYKISVAPRVAFVPAAGSLTLTCTRAGAGVRSCMHKRKRSRGLAWYCSAHAPCEYSAVAGVIGGIKLELKPGPFSDPR